MMAVLVFVAVGLVRSLVVGMEVVEVVEVV